MRHEGNRMNTTISPPPPGAPGHPWRSAWAVFAGILANFVLAGATDAVLHASGVYPPWLHPMADGLWALALGYRAVINVLGGYLTARLAPRRPMRHVAVLMGIGSLLGLMGVVATVGKGPEY